MNNSIVIHWFRQDLRIGDNPSLFEAAKQGTVLPVYILDDLNAGEHRMGAASRWWLYHSLKSLDNSLKGALHVYVGDPKKILIGLVNKHEVKNVCWNRCYEPWRINRDKEIKEALIANNVNISSFNGSLLWEPWNVLKKDGTPYKVFTPYYRNGCMNTVSPRMPLPTPDKLALYQDKNEKTPIDSLSILSTNEWSKKLNPHWEIGEAAAQTKLRTFMENRLRNYKQGRDFPAQNSVSRLSPHLHFGEISPNQAWYAAKSSEQNDDLDHFLRELGWREFSHSLLYHFPKLPRDNLQAKFNHFPWLENSEHLQSWQKGQTGHPLIDAGMRELWQTGYMHNRVRMVVGSFLVKNLLLHWRHGERWFWDCLLDADLANNSAGWQWIAGCGTVFQGFQPKHSRL